MIIKSLQIIGFRSFMLQSFFSFNPGCTVIYGPNAVGKTNLLEAIYTVNYGHGFRTKTFDELFNHNSNALALSAVISEKEKSSDLKITVQARKKSDVVKQYAINGAKQSLNMYCKRTAALVLFQPQNILFITGAPDVRRAYIDSILSANDTQYYQARINYIRGLYKRNKLISSIIIGKQKMGDVLDFWDSYLEENSVVLHKKRTEFISFFNARSTFDGAKYKILYNSNIFTVQKAQKMRRRDFSIGRTTFGSQHDDYIIQKIEGTSMYPLALFGSRSEQRLGVLWMKHNELKYVEKITESKPLFLLDDVFSELDVQNSVRVLSFSHDYQTIITTADKSVFSLFDFEHKTIALKKVL